MDMENQTTITEFILLGFSRDIRINILLFLLFFMIYSITIVGNFLLICIILTNVRLHIPMYFFLCNLSFIDFCYSSTAVPKLLSDLFSIHRTISFMACGMQLYIILFMGGTECQLLVLMAYDRYVAICRPLHYPVVMRWSVCFRLAAFVWIFSFMINIVPTLATPTKLCNPNRIDHFMCELLAIQKLSCDDIHANDHIMIAINLFSLLLPFMFIIVSYTCIISSVLKIHSAGRSKAFSTCTSHIIVVVLYFGTGMVTYFGPSSQYSSNQEKYISIFYVIICPMLNPLIYSLNNREVKKSFHSLFSNRVVSGSMN